MDPLTRQLLAQALAQGPPPSGDFPRRQIGFGAEHESEAARQASNSAFTEAMGHYGYGTLMGGLGLAAGGAAAIDPEPVSRAMLGLLAAGGLTSSAKHARQGRDREKESYRQHELQQEYGAEATQARRGYPSNARGAENMSMAAHRLGRSTR